MLGAQGQYDLEIIGKPVRIWRGPAAVISNFILKLIPRFFTPLFIYQREWEGCRGLEKVRRPAWTYLSEVFDGKE